MVSGTEIENNEYTYKVISEILVPIHQPIVDDGDEDPFAGEF